jgi:hypothetical protein
MVNKNVLKERTEFFVHVLQIRSSLRGSNTDCRRLETKTLLGPTNRRTEKISLSQLSNLYVLHNTVIVITLMIIKRR